MTAVSVVIPHYGDPGPTRLLCLALLSQLGDRDELIVVDDCSPSPFPEMTRVHLVRRERNGGFGTAVNSGVGVSSNPLLLILNSDLSVGATFVRDLIRAAAPWQPCVAGPRLIEPYGLNHSARHFPKVRHQVAEWLNPLARWHGKPWMLEALGQDASATNEKQPTITDWLVGAALLISRRDFIDVGGFDEGYFMTMEEVDLQRRLRTANVPALYVPGVVVEHAGGGSSDPGKRAAWLWTSRMRYADKWGNATVLRFSLRFATLINACWNTLRFLRNRDVSPIGTFREESSVITRASQDLSRHPR